jgi:hypothetical protein
MGDTSETLTPAPEAPAESAPEPQAPAAPVAPVDQEAADQAALEATAIEVPEGDGIVKLVPLSAVTTARDRAKAARDEAKAAKDQLATLQGQMDAQRPYLEAARAILQQPQAQPQPAAPVGPSPEQTAELEEVARDLEFYKTDGTLDLDRAGRHQARILAAAQKIARQEVAPYQQQAAISKAQSVLNEAKNLTDPATGERADPQILTNLWNKVAHQPGGMDTLANPEAAMFIWGQAMNLTRWGKGGAKPPAAAAAPPAAPLGAPVFVEASGGGSQSPVMSSMERKIARDMGMTDAEYLKAAEKAPRGA